MHFNIQQYMTFSIILFHKNKRSNHLNNLTIFVKEYQISKYFCSGESDRDGEIKENEDEFEHRTATSPLPPCQR